MGGLSSSDDVRLSRLLLYFNRVISGQRELQSSREGKQFIEAICAQSDYAKCLYKLTSNPPGLAALQACVRFDTSPSAINEHSVHLLQYLQSPSLEHIDSGSALAKALTQMVDPPFFWDAYTKAFLQNELQPKSVQAYAWLLFRLSSLPGKLSKPYMSLAKNPNVLRPLLEASEGETRNIGQKIKHLLSLQSSDLKVDADIGPGGRHNNDHSDYTDISIIPTADELLSRDRPFLRTPEYLEDPGLASSSVAIHKDNQFRLLREDMVGEIREEIRALEDSAAKKFKGIILDGLKLVGVEAGTDRSRTPWGIKLQYVAELPHLTKLKAGERTSYLEKRHYILRHQSMACLILDGVPVAFPNIHRIIRELAMSPAVITLQLQEDSALPYTLFKLKTAERIKLAQLNSAVFAFEPFLKRLQDMRDIPLSDELLLWKDTKPTSITPFAPNLLIKKLKANAGSDLRGILGINKQVVLDKSQFDSLCSSLSNRVSLIQGPPGTGKSFIGALAAKVLYDSTTQVILVICFTNHALDQFLEDLIDVGIPQSVMVRLGGKSTVRTKPLTLREQRGAKLTPAQWDKINKLEKQLIDYEARLREVFKRYDANVNKRDVLDYLEFADEDLPFYEAFTVPENNTDNMVLVGRRGKKVDPFYLLDRWYRGETNPGALRHYQPRGVAPIWQMPIDMRRAAQGRWQKAILDDVVGELCQVSQAYNEAERELGQIRQQRDASIIMGKKIIACTTNGAAKFSTSIQSASPGIVLIEEAGEILEAHVLTALGSNTKQLIMIGDHQQLRPKCSYELSVTAGNGYDLNRSLFERLVIKGFPHVTLSKQHRMRPEISSLIRHLTYPGLMDAPSTLNRDDLRGFRDNVMFITHSEPEIELEQARELREMGSKTSKQNDFEAQMILKCVRYLAQQGYGSDKLVVLTPYLGQLRLLQDKLSEDNDPILNDLDRFDLVRAGLLTDHDSKSTKPSLKISSIDNYQGEESDIVLVSLTRSNKSKDIGFMAEPERLNVMISRARNALIIIGNTDNFLHARKGSDVWKKFLNELKDKNHIYSGFPIKCEKHPNRTVLASTPGDFELHAPDGGCTEPCGTKLKCGVHTCPSSCHQIFDHSRIECRAVLKQQCPNSHTFKWQCSKAAPASCYKCESLRKAAEKKAQKDMEEQLRQDAAAESHRKQVAGIQDQIDQITQKMKDSRIKVEQQNILRQKREDLVAAKERARRLEAVPSNKPENPVASNSISSSPKAGTAEHIRVLQGESSRTPKASSQKANIKENIKICMDHNASGAQTEWQRQKDQEGAVNPAIDSIMEMIGLEGVKSQVLTIKSKVETSKRQGIDLKKERLGLVLLGNPGTGKTTVARYYAKVLTSLGILPGDGFIETTGSRLANGGVNEVKNHLKSLEEGQGGVYFIDEAYQLAEGHNFGGKQVLDYLLAEIENLTGKIVFVFAGYRKEMEKFFEHNPGISSRIPYTLHFEDYTDQELLNMLQYKMKVYYNSAMGVEGGSDGLYMRIATKRLGRGRGKDGFGNARALEEVFARIRERQSRRLDHGRKNSALPDDLHMTKEDLIGPDPSEAILKSTAWEKLQKLTGLKSVKDSVRFLIDLIGTNYKRELQEKELVEVPLNRVFLGSPGTGKTTVAKLYGQILADIGLLSKGEVVIKNPADFIGSVIGQSEANTKNILANTLGKVLVIDEAYMLYSGASGEGGNNSADVYKTAVIDTIVAEVQSTPGEDRCVLLLGYEDQMLRMFQNVNPGLQRRFQLSDAFRFEDFNDTELQEILCLKLQQQGLGASDRAISVAIDVLGRARNGLNFGNGGDVENLISKAKGHYQTRQSQVPLADRSIDFFFEPEDFDPDFNRAAGAETNLQDLFKGVVGCEKIITKLEGYLKVAKAMRTHGREPRDQIPMNLIFKGPPGTGKTTTARKFGQVYYDLGFLSKVEVVECSATDLIGQYVGHTGPKTIKQLERGLGKVLFVDEAYRLGEGPFAQEAVNELVDTMTKPRFAGKMVIILAGYDNDMNNLLRANEGLSSRFADEVNFEPLTSQHCLRLLREELKQNEIELSTLQDPITYSKFLEPISKMSKLPAWGNARDILTLAKRMVMDAYQTNDTVNGRLIISEDKALSCIQSMLSEKQKRANAPSTLTKDFQALQSMQAFHQPPPSAVEASTTVTMAADSPPKEDDALDKDTFAENTHEHRDAGVSDSIWAQLQQDKLAMAQEAQRREKAIQDKEEERRAAEAAELRIAEEAKLAVLREKQAKDEAERIELGRRREQARIRELEAKAARERIERELERQRQAEMEEAKREQKAQAKLRHMGMCSAGFQWIKQSGGYRCAGGYHWVSDAELVVR